MTVKHIFCLAVLALFLVQVFGAARRLEETDPPFPPTTISSTTPTTTTEAVKTCTGRAPCGWAVYDKISRFINYFMRNKCECAPDKKCLRDEDDISITAYVYRCKIDDSPSSSPSPSPSTR